MNDAEKIAHLNGQVIALTLYVRALLDKHPHTPAVLGMADTEIESMIASLLAKPTQDAAIDGLERIRQMVQPAPKCPDR